MFSQSSLPLLLLKEIERVGYSRPTSIQAQGLPIALSVNTATFAMEAGGYDLSVSTDLFVSGGGLLDNRGEEGGRGGEGEGGFRMTACYHTTQQPTP